MAMRTIAPFLAYEADAGGTGVPLLAKGTPGQILVAAADTTQTSLVATAYRLTDGMEFVPAANNHGAVEGFRVELPDEAPGIWFVSGPVASYQPTVEGSRGERGLPGPDAIENDETVGTYMATPGTRTRSETKVLVSSEVDNILDGRAAAILTDTESEAFQTIAQHFTTKGELVANVADFGAVGDGLADDTPAAQAAVNSLATTGGTVFFPPGKTYKLAGAIELVSNLTVEFTGATLYKDGVNLTSANVFIGKSRGGKGYGSGPSNIVLRGGTISGRYNISASSGAGTTLHHSQNVLFENITFRTALITGHAIDLGGCDAVTIRNCTFAGWSTAAGREYVEAIQLDNSFAIGIGIDTDLTNVYDGLATRNTIIEGCRFVPAVVNGVTYPAPNPVGNHSVVQDNPVTGLVFRNNYMIGGRRTDDVGASTLRGWLHFFTGNDVQIVGNTFVNTGGASSCVVGIRTGQNGILLTDVGNTSAINKPVTPTPVTNLTIEGNTFTGFNGAEVAERVINIIGVAAAKVAGVQIVRNNITKSHPTSTNGGTGTTLAYVELGKNIAIEGNTGDDIYRIADMFTCDGASFSRNQFTRVRAEPVRCSNSSSVTYADNAFRESSVGFYANNIAGLTMHNNHIQGSGANLTNIMACTFFSVHDNVYTAIGTVNEGMSAWNTCQNGRITNNFFSGTFTSKVVNVGTNVNVTVTGTV